MAKDTPEVENQHESTITVTVIQTYIYYYLLITSYKCMDMTRTYPEKI